MRGGRAPTRLPVVGGGWLRCRPIGGNARKVLLTAPDGRFLLLDQAEVAPLERDDQADAESVLRRLRQLGFVHAGTPRDRPPYSATSVGTHVAYLGIAGQRPMDVSTAAHVVEHVVAGSSKYVRLELRGIEAPAEPAAVETLLGLAADRTRAAGAQLSLSVLTDGHISDHLLDLLADAHVFWNVELPIPSTDPTAGVRRLHELYSSRGTSATAAYVTAVITVTRPVLELGARAVVEACVNDDIVYVLLRPLSHASATADRFRGVGCNTEEFLAFCHGAAEVILEVNGGGHLLVDKRLALHLEALTQKLTLETVQRPRLAERAYGPDGRVYAQAAGPLLAVAGAKDDLIGEITDTPVDLARAAEAWNARHIAKAPSEAPCGACVYDPYCDSDLLHAHLLEDEIDVRAAGSAFCERSMATFDETFALLTSPRGEKVRRVFGLWSAARDRVSVGRGT